MKNYLILSEKIWHQDLTKKLSQKIEANWLLINKKEDFNLQKLQELQPDKIFIPHWSYIIPSLIYERFECIVFHMTDLPYGRGGSPLQNLIVRGHQQTKITALRVVKELDAGDIYLKKDLPLFGTAQEILIRATAVIEEMIVQIIAQDLNPKPQEGVPTFFKRRKPEDGQISDLKTIEQVYDYIRMLDADTYPKAFIELENFRLEFSRASWQADKSIIADVRIIPK
jgi:methionyl-tRNA formyltransferase